MSRDEMKLRAAREGKTRTEDPMANPHGSSEEQKTGQIEGLTSKVSRVESMVLELSGFIRSDKARAAKPYDLEQISRCLEPVLERLQAAIDDSKR